MKSGGKGGLNPPYHGFGPTFSKGWRELFFFKICIILYNNNIFYPTFGKGWSKSAEGFMEGFAPLRTKLTEAQAPVKKEFKGWTTPN
jgi:hypothetical protein